MTTIKIEILRTKEVVEKLRLLTGQNIPEILVYEVDPSEFSLEFRKILLDYNKGTYPESLSSINYDKVTGEIQPSATSSGRFEVSDEEITIEVVEEVITKHYQKAKDYADKKERERQNRLLDLERKKEKEAIRKRELDAARVLLKDEFKHLEDKVKRLEYRLKTLSSFVKEIGTGVLEATVKDIVRADSATRIDSIKADLQEASTVQLFD